MAIRLNFRDLFVIILCTFLTKPVQSQYLSNLAATSSDPLFTTYAAPMTRTFYKADQAYRLLWTDQEKGVEFISSDGPNFGLAIGIDDRLLIRLKEFHRPPVITTSYADLVLFYYFPVADLRVEVSFTVYSSSMAVAKYRFINEGRFPTSFSALPYLYLPCDDSIDRITRLYQGEGFSFLLKKNRDGWMKEHDIPLVTAFRGSWSVEGTSFQKGYTFIQKSGVREQAPPGNLFDEVTRSISSEKRGMPYMAGMVRSRNFSLQPGEATSFTVYVELQPLNMLKNGLSVKPPVEIDFKQLIRDDEKAYASIPKPVFHDRKREMLYWSAFSLMRQCMMPPGGKCGYNYYVFSREPRWGWGYGGQVFHESLVMLAYAYMDPAGAMNSQRVFMERQEPDGYINYRSGPYLDEKIVTNGVATTSAPWFSYENLELYKITGDRAFLREAYAAGSRLYRYFVAKRDSNNNGLCEWGGHAELESVRDARVAVWDKVGWASNFEGPDINSMLVMESRSLSDMAKILGNSSDLKFWLEETSNRSSLINKVMWDTTTRFYYNVTAKDQDFTYKSTDDLKIKEIIGFLPLWAGVADSTRAAMLVAMMTDSTAFWRRYGVPSLSADHDYYCPIGYWNGPVWIQWQYLLYRGLRDYGYHRTASVLTDKIMSTMIHHLEKDHDFWEFYSADDLQAGWNRSYIWAGIIARFMIDESLTPYTETK